MIVPEHYRFPVSYPIDPFLVAARRLLGEEQLWPFRWPRIHPLDVARNELRAEVRELLGDRALPCSCRRSNPDADPAAWRTCPEHAG